MTNGIESTTNGPEGYWSSPNATIRYHGKKGSYDICYVTQKTGYSYWCLLNEAGKNNVDLSSCSNKVLVVPMYNIDDSYGNERVHPYFLPLENSVKKVVL